MSLVVVVFRVDGGVVRGGSVTFWGFGARSRSRSASWWAGEGGFVFGFSDAGSRAAADRKTVRREKRRLGGNMFFAGFARIVVGSDQMRGRRRYSIIA